MMSFEEMLRLVFGQVNGWARAIVRHLPNLAVAILVIFLFGLLARLVRNLVVRALGRVSDNPGLVTLTGTIAVLVVNAAGLFVALGVLGLDKTVTSLLAGAGVIALAVGFAFQDLTTNFISGTFIALQRPIQVGDVVETNGFTGKVVEIKLRSVLLNNGQGQEIEIPSKDVFQKPLTNFSRTGQRRIEVSAGLSYLDDLEKAQRVALKAIRALPFALKNPPVELHYRGFTMDHVQFVVWFWIDPVRTNSNHAQSEAIKALKKAFDEADLLMMFPPHTFDLKKRKREELGPKPPSPPGEGD
jgi:small conductance mechanosensitive channel